MRVCKKVMALTLVAALTAGSTVTVRGTNKSVQQAGEVAVGGAATAAVNRISDMKQGDLVEYGMKKDTTTPIKWRVLQKANGNIVDADGKGTQWLDNDIDEVSNGDAAYLLSEETLTPDGFKPDSSVQFGNNNSYQGSNLQKWCNNQLVDGSSDRVMSLSESEKAGILSTYKNDAQWTTGSSGYQYNAKTNILIGDKIFVPSAEEVDNDNAKGTDRENSKNGFTDNNSRIAYYDDGGIRIPVFWWLRSAYTKTSNSVGAVMLDGSVGDLYFNDAMAVRPAFNLNQNAVVFATKQTETSQSENGNTYKLALLDKNATVEFDKATVSGDKLSLPYSYASTDYGNIVLEVTTTSEKGTTTKVSRADKGTATSGTAEFDLTDLGYVAGKSTIKACVEKVDSNEATTLASAFQDVDTLYG